MVPYQSQPGGIKEWETAESVQTILQFLRDNRFLGLNTGGVAALNHRLMFQLKAGRSPSPTEILDKKDVWYDEPDA